MKKLIVALAFLPSLAFANTVKYDVTLLVTDSNWEIAKPGDVGHGSFVINYAASTPADTTPIGASYDALTNARYEVGGHVYEQTLPAWAWQIRNDGSSDGAGFQDVSLSENVSGSLGGDGGDVFQDTDLSSSPNWQHLENKNWFISSMQKVGETVAEVHASGRIIGITSSGDQLADASPTPEPGTLALFGSSLIALAGFRRKKR